MQTVIKKNFKTIGVFGGLYGNIVYNSPKDYLFLFIPLFKNKRKKKRAREKKHLKTPTHTFSEEKNACWLKNVLIAYSFDFRKYTMVNYQLADKKTH